MSHGATLMEANVADFSFTSTTPDSASGPFFGARSTFFAWILETIKVDFTGAARESGDTFRRFRDPTWCSAMSSSDPLDSDPEENSGGAS